jgi:hypothetical protein|tara:strand:- start:771 stop:893 length:123 start_codon:yes stop_codon:yes gene_type:complete
MLIMMLLPVSKGQELKVSVIPVMYSFCDDDQAWRNPLPET